MVRSRQMLFAKSLFFIFASQLVAYEVHPLNPANYAPFQWIHEPLGGPLPIGRVYSGNPAITSINSSRDLLTTELRIWLEEPCGIGEESQIHRNDGLLKAIMLLAKIPLHNFSRNKSVATTGKERPDFVAFHGNVPIFIVEEKDGVNIAEAEDDCRKKFSFIPSLEQFDYFICLAICFTKVTILQMQRSAVNQPYTHRVSIANEADRVDFLRFAVNIARVLRYWIESDQIYQIQHPMHCWIDRPEKKIRLGFKGCEVKYQDEQKFDDMLLFYKECRDIPHLEQLAEHRRDHLYMLMKPLGASRLPRTLGELLKAMKALIEAVNHLHLKRWCHTDIRWDNVVYEDSLRKNWVLIDCFNAVKLPETVGTVDNPARRARVISFQDDRQKLSELITEFPNIGPTARSRLEPIVQSLVNDQTQPLPEVLILVEHMIQGNSAFLNENLQN